METRLAKGEVPVVLPTGGNYMPDPAAGDLGAKSRRRRRMVGVLADAAVGLRPLGELIPRVPPPLSASVYAAMLRIHD